MRQTLHRRLQYLEIESARALTQCASRNEEGLSLIFVKLQLFLHVREIEQDPRESLVEAVSRGLGIGSWEFRDLLAQGIDPIHQYYADHGVFEEIERRKAAGTWPSGERERQNVTA